MKKIYISAAFSLMLGSIASAACIGEWNFENNLNASQGGVNGGKKGTSDLSYVDSVVQGTQLGNYVVNKDLGKAVSIDGNSWIGLGDVKYKNALTPTNSFTIMSYINFSDFSADKQNIGIFGTGANNSSGFAMGISKGNNNGYKFDFLQKGVAHVNTDVISGLIADSWMHVALSYDATSKLATWYLNGDVAATQTITGNFKTPGEQGSAIGSNSQDSNNSCGFVGKMDHMQVYNEALAQNQILSNAGLASVPEPATASLGLLGLGALLMRRRRA